MNEKKYLIKSKKQMFLVIGVFALILLLGTTSYAFFNYTRAGSDNSIGTGRINFVSTQSGTTSISNYFPQIPGGASAEQSSLATISVTGGTTFSGGINYYVKLIDVKVGNRAYDPETDVPVNIDVGSYTSLNDTTNNHGTFTPVIGTGVGVGIALSEGVIIANGTIGVADTAANSDNWINGTFTVQAYIPSNVAISDTTGEYESTAYVNGTTTTWVAGRRVLTTAQWNALSTNPVTFKIQVVANEGTPPVVINYNANGGTIATASKTIAPDATTYGTLAEPTPDTGYLFAGWYTEANGGTPVTSATAFTNGSATTLYAHYALESSIKCKRVTNIANLNTETCQQSSNYCAADGYTGSNTTITYGNAKELGSELTVGDAFDCNVDGTGYNERFYYVSPYYNTNSNNGATALTFDDLSNNNSYATLIYYSNTKEISGTVTASTEGASYFSYSSSGTGGPMSALTQLPTTSQWSNVNLKTSTRAMLAEYLETHNATTSSGHDLNQNFSYSGKAARLLTAQELMRGCGLTQVGSATGELSNCQFLFEGTKYADNNKATYGPYLETYNYGDPIGVWSVYVYDRRAFIVSMQDTTRGVRPTIDVPVSALLK